MFNQCTSVLMMVIFATVLGCSNAPAPPPVIDEAMLRQIDAEDKAVASAESSM